METEEAEEMMKILFRDITKKNIMKIMNTIGKRVADDTENKIYNKILKGAEKKEILNYMEKNYEVYKETEFQKIC